jgi:hypothetical protein
LRHDVPYFADIAHGVKTELTKGKFTNGSYKKQQVNPFALLLKFVPGWWWAEGPDRAIWGDFVKLLTATLPFVPTTERFK